MSDETLALLQVVLPICYFGLLVWCHIKYKD